MKSQLLLAALVLVVLLGLPLWAAGRPGLAGFGGPPGPAGGGFAATDEQALALITESHPDYQPWFHAFWTPPNPEIENLLFTLQAALGAGALGYYLGLIRGRQKGANRGGPH